MNLKCVWWVLLAFTYFLNAGAYASIVQEILAQENPDRRHNTQTVYDIDGTLCEVVRDAGQNRQEILKRLPRAMVLPFYDGSEKTSYSHVFYPDFAELFLTLLSWGWDISFFSAGVEERSAIVIPAYFKYALAPYCDNPAIQIPQLLDKRIAVYSKQHLKSEKDIEWINQLYMAGGKKKKDLRILTDQMDSCILVEDDSTYAVGGHQYPYLKGNILLNCKEFYYRKNEKKDLYAKSLWEIREDSQFKDGHYPQKDYAAYQLGIFIDCKKIMDEQKKPLRIALSEVLKIEKSYKDHKKFGPCILYVKDLDYGETGHSKIQRWIDQGQSAIAQMRQNRLNYDPSLDVYNAMAQEYYGRTEFEKESASDCNIM